MVAPLLLLVACFVGTTVLTGGMLVVFDDVGAPVGAYVGAWVGIAVLGAAVLGAGVGASNGMMMGVTPVTL